MRPGTHTPYLWPMTYFRWSFRILVLVLLFGFLHYTLPQRDIVRIVNTYEERQDFEGWTTIFWSGPDMAGTALASKDVLFIQTVQANGDPMVYRNQDTRFWPPYLKFDTADLQTEAADAVSTKDMPEWYALRHYGWRNNWLSIFPNALSLKPVENPDQRLIPWFNIVFLTLLAMALITLWRLWRNFWERRIDPVLEDVGEAGDAARSRFGRWFGRG